MYFFLGYFHDVPCREKLANFVTITATAYVLTRADFRTSTFTGMTEIWSRIYTEPAIERFRAFENTQEFNK